MSIVRLRELALILAAYALALGAGVLAVWWKNRGIGEPDQQAMSGMFAFGDAVLFSAISGPLAIFPTVLLFRQLGPAPRWWRAHATVSLCAALTGALAALLLLAPPAAGTGGLLETLAVFAPLRVLAAPLALLVYSPGSSPPRLDRGSSRSSPACSSSSRSPPSASSSFSTSADPAWRRAVGDRTMQRHGRHARDDQARLERPPHPRRHPPSLQRPRAR